MPDDRIGFYPISRVYRPPFLAFVLVAPLWVMIFAIVGWAMGWL